MKNIFLFSFQPARITREIDLLPRVFGVLLVLSALGGAATIVSYNAVASETLRALPTDASLHDRQ